MADSYPVPLAPQHGLWHVVGIEQGLQNTCDNYLVSVFMNLIV